MEVKLRPKDDQLLSLIFGRKSKNIISKVYEFMGKEELKRVEGLSIYEIMQKSVYKKDVWSIDKENDDDL